MIEVKKCDYVKRKMNNISEHIRMQRLTRILGMLGYTANLRPTCTV